MACLLFAATVVSAAESPSKEPRQESPLDRIKWQQGPSSGALGNFAQIKIPENYVFAASQDTKLLMEAMQNPVSGRELGSGYIRDDEKGSLDAAAILASIKAGNEEGNKERERRGWAKFEITGWQQQPRYDEKTNNLEWAIKGQSDGKPVVNYNTRILGRGGVMRVTLVAGPEELEATLPQYKAALAGFGYNSGYKYAEYRQGDKLATYGLSALVVGGATAAAVKSGAFKWLWKVGGLAVLAALGFVKKLFGGRKASDMPT
jgi:uncharacterized membrane-anchored protein